MASCAATSIAQLLSQLLLGDDDVRDMGSRIEHIFSLLKRHSPEMATRVQNLVALSSKEVDVTHQQQKEKEQAARKRRDAFMADMTQRALNFDLSNIDDSSDSNSDSNNDSNSDSDSDSDSDSGADSNSSSGEKSGIKEEAKEAKAKQEMTGSKTERATSNVIECALCRGSADSPFGLVCFAQITSVLKQQKQQTERTVDEPVPCAAKATLATGIAQTVSAHGSAVSGVARHAVGDRHIATSSFARDDPLDRFASDSSSRAVCIGTCGHYLHITCFHAYYKTLRQRHAAGQNFEGKQVPTSEWKCNAQCSALTRRKTDMPIFCRLPMCFAANFSVQSAGEWRSRVTCVGVNYAGRDVKNIYGRRLGNILLPVVEKDSPALQVSHETNESFIVSRFILYRIKCGISTANFDGITFCFLACSKV